MALVYAEISDLTYHFRALLFSVENLVLNVGQKWVLLGSRVISSDSPERKEDSHIL